MNENKNFQLIYKVEAEQLDAVVCLAFEVMGETGMEPESINLPDGRTLPWNAFLADKFAAEGHITEAEFIEMSLSKS